MHLQSAAALLALLASACPHVTHAEQQGLRRKLAANDCTIMAVEALGLEEGEDPEMIVECELNPADADGVSGISLLLDANPAQLGALRQLINNGEVTPGHHKLNIAGAEIDDSTVHVPPGLDIASSVRQNVEKDGRRRLVDTIGNLNMLLVKVTDVGGLVYPDSATTMSDEVFGTGVDPVNLKSGLEECSWDKLTHGDSKSGFSPNIKYFRYGAKNHLQLFQPITKKTHTMVLTAYAAIAAKNNHIMNPRHCH